MSQKHIWITGATGFLGGHVRREFLEAGWTVSGIDIIAPSDESFLPSHWFKGPVSIEALDHLAREGQPDCIFHAAGNGSVGASFDDPDMDFSGSVTATKTILDFIRDQAPQATFAFPSSAGVYGACPAEPLVEGRAPAPVSPYGKHKLMAENLCLQASEEHNIRTIAVRFFSLYGAGLRKQLLWDLASKAMAATDSVELFGTGQETRDMLEASDAANIILKLVETAGQGATLVNGGTGRALSVHQIATMLLAALGKNLEIQFNGEDRPGDPKYYEADMAHAHELGLALPETFDVGAIRYAQWFKSVYRE